MIAHQTDPLAIKMAESTPRLFVTIALLMMISGLSVMFWLGHEVFAQAPEQRSVEMDEAVLKLIMHRNTASTNWSYAF